MTALATPLQTKYQLTASSLNSSCIVWRCALGPCPVVGGNWLQSSAVHRVWHDIAKWSDCNNLSLSVLFLFIYHILYHCSVHLTFWRFPVLMFPSPVLVFMFDLSLSTARVCVCTIRLFPGRFSLFYPWLTKKLTAFSDQFSRYPILQSICTYYSLIGAV